MNLKPPIRAALLLTALLSCRSVLAEEVSAKDEAPALLAKANKWVEDNTKEKIGFTVLGVDVYVHRDIRIDDVSYDPDSTVMRIKGHIRYKTGPNAAVPVDAGSDFDIRYTARSGEIEGAKFSISNQYLGTVDIDLTPLKQALDGDISKLLEYIPNGGLVKRRIWSEYDDRKKEFEDRYHKENVYFASSDFVRWASPETAGRWVIELVASYGSATSAIAAEAKTQARKELTQILSWLANRAGNAAQNAVESLLNGEPIQLPQLKLLWQEVDYRSQVVIADHALPETPAIPHAAFVLIWETPGGPTATFISHPGQQKEDSSLRPKWSIGSRYAIGPTGCQIVFVRAGGASDKAGLKVDDVITRVNSKKIGSADFTTDNIIKILKSSPDDRLQVEFLRGGNVQNVTLTLDPAP